MLDSQRIGVSWGLSGRLHRDGKKAGDLSDAGLTFGIDRGETIVLVPEGFESSGEKVL